MIRHDDAAYWVVGRLRATWHRDSDFMKKPNIWLDVFTLGSAILCLYALAGLAFYFVWSKIDSSMARIWSIKRQFYLPVLIGAFGVGVPLWLLFVRDYIRNRKDR